MYRVEYGEYGVFKLNLSIPFITVRFLKYKLILCQVTNKPSFISDPSLFTDECQTNFSVAPVPFAVLSHPLVGDGHLAQP